MTPSVQEQHQYWVPVNFSSATLIQTYLKAYHSTGRMIHLAKAIDLANTLLAVQELHHGEYPTYPMLPTEDGKWEATQNVWINCGVGTARAVLESADVLRDRRQALIKNHTTWQDLGGNPIWAHDGGLSRFGDRFYWYGTSYEGNPTGQYGMAKPRLWNGVQLYSSDNLVVWASEGVVLPRPEKGWGNLGTSGRPHVLDNQKTRIRDVVLVPFKGSGCFHDGGDRQPAYGSVPAAGPARSRNRRRICLRQQRVPG